MALYLPEEFLKEGKYVNHINSHLNEDKKKNKKYRQT